MCLLTMLQKLISSFIYSYNSTLKSSAHKQTTYRHYIYEMKSLSSIFSRCNAVKIVVLRKDRLTLSHGDNHFDLFVITLAEIICRQTSNSLTYSTRI